MAVELLKKLGPSGVLSDPLPPSLGGWGAVGRKRGAGEDAEGAGVDVGHEGESPQEVRVVLREERARAPLRSIGPPPAGALWTQPTPPGARRIRDPGRPTGPSVTPSPHPVLHGHVQLTGLRPPLQTITTFD